MKSLMIATLLLSLEVSAFTSGYYNCAKGNSNTICPQRINLITTNGVLTLSVEYAGGCSGRASSYYTCQNESTCGDAQIGFKKVSQTSYDWVNRNFNMNCRFELSTSR